MCNLLPYDKCTNIEGMLLTKITSLLKHNQYLYYTHLHCFKAILHKSTSKLPNQSSTITNQTKNVSSYSSQISHANNKKAKHHT